MSVSPETTFDAYIQEVKTLQQNEDKVALMFSNGRGFIVDKSDICAKDIDALAQTYCHVIESTKENILQIFSKSEEVINSDAPIYNSDRAHEANNIIGSLRMEYRQEQLPFDINEYYFNGKKLRFSYKDYASVSEIYHAWLVVQEAQNEKEMYSLPLSKTFDEACKAFEESSFELNEHLKQTFVKAVEDLFDTRSTFCEENEALSMLANMMPEDVLYEFCDNKKIGPFSIAERWSIQVYNNLYVMRENQKDNPSFWESIKYMNDLLKYNDYLRENQDKVTSMTNKLNTILLSSDTEELLLQLGKRLKAEGYPGITPDRIVQDLVETIRGEYMHDLEYSYEERLQIRVVVPLLRDLYEFLNKRKPQ